MVSVAGGSFSMGSLDDTLWLVQPIREVTLSAFKMGKYEVTQGQWAAVMETNPFSFDKNPEDSGPNGWKNLPVETVSYYEALAFCNKLSMLEGLTPAYSIRRKTDPETWSEVLNYGDVLSNVVSVVEGSTGYRLPTEAQWEYAARGGSAPPDEFTYSGSNTAEEVSWYDDNSDGKTHEVGKKAANALGLYDMSGNVWEWCWDWYDTYPSQAETDPMGPPGPGKKDTTRVIRGGCWGNVSGSGRVAARAEAAPVHRGGNVGFRIVRP